MRLAADSGRVTTTRRLVVPAYFHPQTHLTEWAMLAQRAPVIRLVILNVASGPGTQPDPAFLAVAEHLRSAGVPLAGYVDTSYGRRRVSVALDEVDRYRDWYQVTGVCFDQAAVETDAVGYYADVAAAARAMGVTDVMFNHGAHPARCYADHADILGTFEGPWSSYLRLTVPRWTRSLPDGTIYHVVHSVPPQRLADAHALAGRHRAGCVYVTQRTGANPYDGLPANWHREELACQE
jgi:Spherulation-specific family 4